MIKSKMTKAYPKSETGIQNFFDRIADFDTIVDCLGLDRSFFYNSLDPDSEFFISNTMDLPISLWAHDENHTVVYGNKFFMEKFGNRCRQKCHDCLMSEGQQCDCCQTRTIADNHELKKCHLCKRNGNGYDINVCHMSMKNRYGKRIFLKTGFHVDDTKAVFDGFYARPNRKTSKQLILTICSGCNKIKVPVNKWIHIDEHILSCFDGRLSHGICPECIDILYPDLKISLKAPGQQTEA